MDKEFLVLYTPGAFGNFIAYLIDSHKANKMLPSPFDSLGTSHFRTSDSTTKNFDMVVPGLWDKVEEQKDKSLVACVWGPEYFRYILHAYYSRSGSRDGKCGIEICQDDFYDYVHKHGQSHMLQQEILDLGTVFGFNVNEQNRKVPRHLLRMYFWYKMVEEEKNVVTIQNQKLKNFARADCIDLDEILDYKKCKNFFQKKFAVDLDFEETHTLFVTKNKSLKEHRQSIAILDAVKNGKNVPIEPMTSMGEAMTLFLLERHYFDIPFFNLKDFFGTTQEIIDYIKYFPNNLKQPNKLFHLHFKKFPRPRQKQ